MSGALDSRLDSSRRHYTVTNNRNGFSRMYTARGASAAVQAPAIRARTGAPRRLLRRSDGRRIVQGDRCAQAYRDASRTSDGFVRLDIFEQIGRPAISRSSRRGAISRVRRPGSAAHKQMLDALSPIRVSDYDQRSYKTLTIGSPRSAANSRSVSVVSHVDVNQDPKVPPMLRRLAEASRQENGNLSSTSCST